MLFRAQRQFSTPPRVDSHQKKQCSHTCAIICPHSQYMSDRQDCIRLLSKSVKRNYRKDCTVFPVMLFTDFILLFLGAAWHRENAHSKRPFSLHCGVTRWQSTSTRLCGKRLLPGPPAKCFQPVTPPRAAVSRNAGVEASVRRGRFDFWCASILLTKESEDVDSSS